MSDFTHKLDPDLKARWLVALRGGKYLQNHGMLSSMTPYGQGFCCLGVLAEVHGIPRSTLLAHPNLDAVGLQELLGPFNGDNHYDFFVSRPDTHTTLQRKLAGMNDSGYSFAQIADWIEANL